MIKSQIQEFKVVFTESIPIDLVDGYLYISMEYCMAKHKCPCGCGLTVITPILPKRWHLYYDGETIETMIKIAKKVPTLMYISKGREEPTETFMKKNCPKTKLYVMGKHMMFWEFPKEFNQVFDDFLREADIQ